MKRSWAVILVLMIGFPLLSFSAYKKPRMTSMLKPPFGASINPTSPLAQGLQYEWIINEGGGQQLYDTASNATMSGNSNPTWTNSQDGSAVVFVATSTQFFQTVNSFTTNWSNDRVTIETWFFLNTANTTRRTIFAIEGNVAGGLSIEANWNSTSGLFGVIIPGLFLANATNPISAGTWQHVFYVRRGPGATHEFWVNGSQNPTTTVNTSDFLSTTAKLNIGRRTPTNLQYFDGKISLVRIWGRDLSVSEMQSLSVHPFSMFKSQNITLPRQLPTSSTSSVSHFFKSLLYKAVIR